VLIGAQLNPWRTDYEDRLLRKMPAALRWHRIPIYCVRTTTTIANLRTISGHELDGGYRIRGAA
jgi:hypothetical protein